MKILKSHPFTNINGISIDTFSSTFFIFFAIVLCLVLGIAYFVAVNWKSYSLIRHSLTSSNMSYLWNFNSFLAFCLTLQVTTSTILWNTGNFDVLICIGLSPLLVLTIVLPLQLIVHAATQGQETGQLLQQQVNTAIENKQKEENEATRKPANMRWCRLPGPWRIYPHHLKFDDTLGEIDKPSIVYFDSENPNGESLHMLYGSVRSVYNPMRLWINGTLTTCKVLGESGMTRYPGTLTGLTKARHNEAKKWYKYISDNNPSNLSSEFAPPTSANNNSWILVELENVDFNNYPNH